MRRLICSFLSSALAALGICMTGASHAEDVDLFRGANGSGAANVLFIVDNSSNWAAANQNWPSVNTGRATALPCGNDCDKQGMAEVAALYDVINSMNALGQVNLGLMLFNNSNASRDGGYVRVNVAPFNSDQKAKMLATLTTIIQNFNTETAASSVQYGAIFWDAFKYFGGYSNPLSSTSLYPSGASNPTYSSIPVFGTAFWGSNNADGTKPDGNAYSSANYNPIVTQDNSCGNNYIVLIGNGFPAKDDVTSSDMSFVLRLLRDPAHAASPAAISQLGMPPYLTSNISSASAASACTATCDSSLTDAQKNQAYGYVCKIGSPTGTNNSSGLLDCNYSVSFSCQKSDCNGSNLRPVASGTPAATTALVTPSGTDARFADEYAKFLSDTDVSSQGGKQSVMTYAVDVFRAAPSAQQTQLMRSIAYYGRGEYYSASDSSQLKEAFADILRKVLARNSVFASASLPVSATNRSQNENQVYIGVFRPDQDMYPRWFGNLKRYQITDFGAAIGLDLGDQYGQRAINQNTGFIDDCAVSFWTVNKGQYWTDVQVKPPGVAINPPLGTACNKTVHGVPVSAGSLSDWPDGPSVEKGAASQMIRLGNDPAATSPTYSPAYATSGASTGGFYGRKIYTLSNGVMTLLSSGSASANAKYIMGFDVNDERPGSTSSGTDTTADVRPSAHGDVIHSRPIPVNYAVPTQNNPNPTPDIAIYYGGNDGLFRAVDSSTGKELWAFMEPEFETRSSASRLRLNSPLVQYPGVNYGTVEKKPKDYFFDGSSSVYQPADNSVVWLFTSQRRGGRMVYAFDISDKTSPAFKWRYGCSDLDNDNNCVGTDAANMAQSWSLPSALRIKLTNGTVKKLVLFGGGYEGGYDSSGNGLCDDRDNIDPGCASSTKGRGVFALDADSGTFLRKFTTTGPVAADLAFVDINRDGYVDFAYVADTRGNLYRISFSNAGGTALVTDGSTLAGAEIVKIAYTNGSSSDNGRKFLFAPAVLPYGSKVYLAIGSGDREHPLRASYPYQNQVKNRFYVFLDDPAAALPNGGYNLDSPSVMYGYTSVGGASCVDERTAVLPDGSRKGWSLTLSDQTATATDTDPHRGEQTVSAALIAGGKVFFSTNAPDSGSANMCTNTLGIARGYGLNLLTGCGYSSIFVGGGLPPSPVVATVPYTAVDGSSKVGTVCIGCAQEPSEGSPIGGSSPTSSPIGGTHIKPDVIKRRTKTYWYSNAQK